MSSARALPAAPPHPELAALLLAFGDYPVGEGDVALGAPRLVLADWLGERDDGREAEVREGVRNEDMAFALAPDGSGALQPDLWATRRRWRRRLLALFPEVALDDVPCLCCDGTGAHAPFGCPACSGSGRVSCTAPHLVPEEAPA